MTDAESFAETRITDSRLPNPGPSSDVLLSPDLQDRARRLFGTDKPYALRMLLEDAMKRPPLSKVVNPWHNRHGVHTRHEAVERLHRIEDTVRQMKADRALELFTARPTVRRPNLSASSYIAERWQIDRQALHSLGIGLPFATLITEFIEAAALHLRTAAKLSENEDAPREVFEAAVAYADLAPFGESNTSAQLR